MPLYRLVTLGCKVNHYESLQVEQVLRNWGYTRSENSTADVVIINTCSITSAAAAKSRNILRRTVTGTTASGGAPKVVVMGCWATSHPETARRIAGETAVLTHQDDIVPCLRALLNPESLSSAADSAAGLPLLSCRQPDNQRAIVKVQDGCDAHCTYCIIPKIRPVLWSKPVPDVLAECRQLLAAGHREIVLTGIFLGAYGQSTAIHRNQVLNLTPATPTDRSSAKAPAAPTVPFTLSGLLRTLCTQLPALPRIRISSLEPADITPALISVLRSYPQIMPHFHIPLQSGSNAILHRMNRQYTREDYLNIVAQLKGTFDRPALTTDIIVGFPGETEEYFEETLDIARRVGFLHIHAFPFSPREGTAAARWKKQFVQPKIVTERMHRLEQISSESSLAYRTPFVGETVGIVVEKPGVIPPEQAPKVLDPAAVSEDEATLVPAAAPVAAQPAAPVVADPSNIRHGRSERYFPVHFEIPEGSKDDLTGQLMKVRITRVSPERTHGECVSR
jgi:threonylcarbamoyladenosine tRNA methylthiotransferase MtaB